MKKIIYLFIICLACLQAHQTYSVVTSYYFDQFVCGNSYTPITGGTTYLINGNDDWIHANINLGFNFTFNGVTYSTCNISTNGFITFGVTAPAFNNYVPLASTETYAGCISAVGMNIRQQGTGELRSMTQGIAPNRTFIVQYKDFGPTVSSELYNFQIVLYETSGRIDINYGAFTVSATRNPQVGLRGAASSDYAARWMLVGQTWLTSSAASCNCATEISTSRFPMANLQYRWMPSAPMTYVSSTLTQTNFADVLLGTTNTEMIGVQIVMTGEQSAQSLQSITFNTIGTTNPAADISNAKVWSTGNTCSFSTTSQLGSAFASPNGSFTVTGLGLTLTPGLNYVWLTYDVNSGATAGNFIDAQCTSVLINGTPCTPSVTSPSGSRKIVGPMSGTLHIGVGKDFTTLTSAVSNLNIRGVLAPITFVLDDAVYSSETFPITIGSIPGASSTNTVTFMLNASLANSSVAPVISGSSSTMLIDFNGADYVTFDGRPGGTGTTKGLTLRNTSTAVTASTIRLINDAQNNTIKYCIIEGSSANTTATGGSIYFATPTSTGNDNNTISFCDIRDRSDASAAPNYGIVSTGSGSFGPDNSGNIITDNNIYNFYLHGGNSAGVFLAAGNTQWTITNNHFYQTATRTTTVSTTSNGINITSGGASFSHIITGNFIGGSAPNASGSPWTVTTSTSGAGNTINGIRINPTSGSLASSIQNNTIKNFNLTTFPTSAGGVWFTGIHINGGANIGNVTPNIIGGTTGNGSITITFGSTAVTTHVRGIDMSSASSFSGSIANNLIGSFTIGGTATGLVTFTGINTGGIPTSAFSISGNTIGSTTTAGSIQTTSTTMPALLNGISSGFTTSTNSITNNNIVNFINASTATNGQLTGIIYTGSVATSITGNIIRDLSTATTGTGTTASANNIVGILSTSANTGQTISTNQIYSLRSTNTGAFNMIVTGIGMNNASSSGTISRNRIYDLSNSAAGSAPAIYGIFTNTPGWSLTNNQVTLTNGEALDNFITKETSENGDASTNNVILRGIYDNSTSGTSNIYYNSVYIGGSISSGSNNSYCYYRDGTATLNLKNNLFYNRRTGGTGFHYAIGNSNATGFASTSSNYNVFISPSSSRVGEWVSGLGRTINEWRTSTSGDAQSWSTTSGTLSGANLFTSISTGNLLIQSGNAEAWIVSGKGTVITGQNIDYEGTTRQVAVSGGVTDIGSDEFAAVPPSSPSATESAPPAAGTTTTYTLYGRTICSITWGTVGTFPSGMSVRYNSGILPSNIVGSGRSSYSYWTVSPSSGSLNGKYCITFNFGDNETYNISSPSTNTILAKKDATVWEVYPLYSTGNTNWKSQLNWTAKTIRVDSLHSFSDFALTDGTLALPVSISSFNASINSRDISLSWVTESELNNNGFDIERKIINDNGSSAEWQKMSFIQGNGTSNTQHNYTYTDKKLPAGKYKYRLKQIDYNGGHEYFELSDAMIIGAPKSFGVTQNYPNPSNPNSKIDFELPADMKVNIKVYDITGREIALLMNESKDAGYYTVDFNGSNIASGVYFYRITAEGSAQKFSKTMKMILVK